MAPSPQQMIAGIAACICVVFVCGVGADDDVGPVLDVKVGDDLVIEWNVTYPSNWTRAVTYWRYYNANITQAMARNVMLRDGLNEVHVTDAWQGRAEAYKLNEFNAGMILKKLTETDAGHYTLQMDFHNQLSKYRTVEVTVTEPSDPTRIIIGVTVAVIFVIILVVVVVILVKKKQRASRGL